MAYFAHTIAAALMLLEVILFGSHSSSQVGNITLPPASAVPATSAHTIEPAEAATSSTETAGFSAGTSSPADASLNLDGAYVLTSPQRPQLQWVPIPSLVNPVSKLVETCNDLSQCTTYPTNYLVGSMMAVSDSPLTIPDQVFTKSADTVYLNGSPLTEADAPSFNVFLAPDGTLYAADKNHAYDGTGEVIAGADPATFTVLAVTGGTYNGIGGYQFARDARQVYFPSDSTPVAGVDPATFTVGPDATYATDKAHLYCVAWSDQSQNYILITAVGRNPASCSMYQ